MDAPYVPMGRKEFIIAYVLARAGALRDSDLYALDAANEAASVYDTYIALTKSDIKGMVIYDTGS